MNPQLPVDIQALLDGLQAAERDAEALVAGLTEAQGTARAEAGSWSVSECLDHLATGNRLYLGAMAEPAEKARARGRYRQRPATAGWAGRLFVHSLEPPPKWWTKMKAPRKIRPRPAPPLEASFALYVDTAARAREFLGATADLDLASIRFPNPFLPGLRFSRTSSRRRVGPRPACSTTTPNASCVRSSTWRPMRRRSGTIRA